MPSRRVSFLDRPSGISPPLDPLWPHPHSAVSGLRGDHSLVFILNVFLRRQGITSLQTWTRWPHSCRHICNSTSRLCSFVYSATIPCSAVPESASALPLLLFLSLSLFLPPSPGLTLCTDQQQQQQPVALGAIWTPPHTGPPQLHRTALGLQTYRLVKHTWCCP